MNVARLVMLCAISLGLCAAASAQSCAGAIPIAAVGNYTGNTCTGSNQLPAIANGAISVASPQVIYAAAPLSSFYEGFQLQADPALNLSVFVCRNPCSTVSSCVAVSDVDATGTSPLHNIFAPTDYFVVVGSTSGTCGSYTLVVSAALDR